MNINCLEEFILLGCWFSKSSYEFEFLGKIEDKPRTFRLCTSYSFTTSRLADKDSLENFSIEIWDMLEKKLVSIDINENTEKICVTFNFENDQFFIVWANLPAEDNLFILHDRNSGEWWPFF